MSSKTPHPSDTSQAVDEARATMSHGEVCVIDYRPNAPRLVTRVIVQSTHDAAYDTARAVARAMSIALGEHARVTEAPNAVFHVRHDSDIVADVISH